MTKANCSKLSVDSISEEHLNAENEFSNFSTNYWKLVERVVYNDQKAENRATVACTELTEAAR